ncbi:MAG: DsrE/DsrF/DrsH-like family protein [Bacteroidales bacterium]|nr:DsrE/DsrF/DrsH-like family protein [Bacteroidales bacterium]
MENRKMCLALFSGCLDKMTAAGVIISGAVADDMDVDVYVLLQGARAMLKDVAEHKDKINMAENGELREEFIQACKNLNVKEWHEFFREAKEIGNVKFHICGLAGKLWGGEKIEDFVDFADDIVGISEYITKAEEADIHLFI